jgi:hypothetical protein
MNKGPKNITMLDVLDAIHDPDGRDLFNSIATERGSNGTSDYTRDDIEDGAAGHMASTIRGH